MTTLQQLEFNFTIPARSEKHVRMVPNQATMRYAKRTARPVQTVAAILEAHGLTAWEVRS